MSTYRVETFCKEELFVGTLVQKKNLIAKILWRRERAEEFLRFWASWLSCSRFLSTIIFYDVHDDVHDVKQGKGADDNREDGWCGPDREYWSLFALGGAVYTFGKNESGQLGLGEATAADAADVPCPTRAVFVP